MTMYQLSIPAQHPVITLVDSSGNAADLSSYIPDDTYNPSNWKVDFGVESEPFSIVQGTTAIAFGSASYFKGFLRYNPSTTLNDGAIWVATLSAGTWRFDGFLGFAADRGIVTVSISYDAGANWTVLGSQDCYNASISPGQLKITGIVVPTSGPARLRFVVTDKNASSSAYGYSLSGAVMSRVS